MAPKNKILRVLASIAAAGLLALGLGGAPGQAAPTSTGQITEVGQQAFKDLSTCLTSGKEKALDVFYLIDSSGSLEYTDKNEVRRTVLENSVSQLKNFADQRVTVSFAAAQFSDSVKQIAPWMQLNKPGTTADAKSFDRAVEVISSRVKNAYAGGFTDWEEGLLFAKNSFANRPVGTCKMLVWLTDGGINPTGDYRDALASLKRLCHPEISAATLANTKGRYGIFDSIRQQQISIFGVLYQNDESTLQHFETSPRADISPTEELELEHYWMSYMRPLVEGSGPIDTSAVARKLRLPPGGTLACAPVDKNGKAPVGQPNGAFLNAQDPVNLAFQFLKMQAVLAGGSGGNPILDGKFEVPLGTAAFRILTTSDKWHLAGPANSKIDAKAGKAAVPGLTVSQSAGVQQIDFKVSDKSEYLGEWKFDAPYASQDNSVIYLFSGLTMELDRDLNSQVVSDRPNTLTGQVLRTNEFASLPVDLSVFEQHNLSLKTESDDGTLRTIDGLEIDVQSSGTFKVEGYTPDSSMSQADLWLTLELGGKFDPVTSRVSVNVIAKSNIATAESSVIKLSDLKGPEGVATGSFLVNGPTAVGSSEFCIGPDPLRTSDAQTAAQHHTRDAKFVWTFESNALSHSENCFTIPQGEQVYIDVEVRNPIQADASVTAIFEANSSTDSAELSENLQFEFKSSALVDETTRNLIIIGLLLLGLIIPLALLYLLNFLTTKFLPVEQMVRAEYAVALQPGPAGKIVDQSGKPIQVDANDFRYLPDMPASKTLDLGLKGKSAARLPLFPLAAPWFEHQAPAGSRVISLYNGGSKSAASFASGQAAEISPNHADNWQLIIPDSEFLKPEGEALAGVLVVGSRMGNLPQYQNRVNEIASKPGLQRRVGEIRAALAAEATSTKPPKRSKGSAKSEGSAVVATPPATISAASIPGISNPAGGTVPPGQPGSPAIPGVPAPAPTGIPGVNPPAGTPGISNPNIPGAPKPPTIPGVNPPK